MLLLLDLEERTLLLLLLVDRAGFTALSFRSLILLALLLSEDLLRSEVMDRASSFRLFRVLRARSALERFAVLYSAVLLFAF